mgnify:CR=1 FL=1
MPLILGTNSIKDTGYDVANSLRFNSGSSDYLNRTPSSASNRKTFTFSFWVKRAKLGTNNTIYNVRPDSNGANRLSFHSATDTFRISLEPIGKYIFTTRKFRDISAWYHIVVAIDTTQSTSSNRVKTYVNGSQETSFSTATYPDQNTDLDINRDVVINIGRNLETSSADIDLYLAEFVFIDGTALDPTSFGEFDSDTPTIWKPIDVSGLTFGTNGFYLDFENSGSLGADVSGNGNNFTVNNLTSVDQSTDTCTNNFATMNPLFAGDSNITYSEGNLKTTAANESQKNAISTIAVSSGKWYCEMVSRNGTNYPGFGIMDIGSTLQTSVHYLGSTADSYVMYQDGNYYNNASATSTGTTWGVGSIMGVAIDLDSGTKTIKFYKNGSETHSATISTPANAYAFAVSHNTNGTITEINFGSPPHSISSGNSDGNGYGNFEYAVPSGYYALNTKNLAEFG